MSMRLDINWKDVYAKEYVGKEMTIAQIATKYKCGKTSVKRNFHSRGFLLRPTSYYHKGRSLTAEHRQKIRIGNLGKKMSPESCKKLSEARKGVKLTRAHRDNIAKSKKGIPLSEEHKRKLSEALIGSKSYLWQGGKSFEIYPREWNKVLKKSIRDRDGHCCQVCGAVEKDIALDVHHIDYDKKNCVPSNLISLCKPCHKRTGLNRGRWLSYFQGPVDDSSILARATG